MKNMLTWHSSLGWMRVVAGEQSIRRITFHPQKETLGEAASADRGDCRHDGGALLREARRQIEAYLGGAATDFDLPLELDGLSPFSRRVVEALRRIPFGETITYAELGRRAGSAGAGRAVGRVMAANPLPIVVPCHRVIPASGGIGSYSAGEGSLTKRRLLELEGATAGACVCAPADRVRR